MAYRLEGRYFENCSCEVLCPCGASGLQLPATYERCIVLLAFRVDSGEVDGVDVSGNVAALLADTPALMAEGGWRVGLFVDERATQEQRDALVAVFTGEQGGPPAMFAALTGERLGVEFAPIDYSEDGFVHSVRIGDAVDVEVEDFPSIEEGRPMVLEGIGHPANSRLAIAQAKRSRIDAFGIDVSLVGRNGHSAPFAWQA